MTSTGLLTINTRAIANNWRLLSKRIQQQNPVNQCGAVIKADAYGLGVAPVAKALLAAGCEEFFVATLAEAIELREVVGKQPRVVVFGGISHGDGDEWQKYQLIPVLFEVSHVERWADKARVLGRPLACAIEMDTGMHRFGIGTEELQRLLQQDPLWDRLQVELFMSHLACADHPEHPLNGRQLQAFKEFAPQITSRYPSVQLSLANSSGLFLGEQFVFDLGRPGAALYGVNPTPKKNNPMQSVITLELPVMQHRTIAAGETVGYGATFKAKRETHLVTVFGGYADGLFRLLSNRGSAFYHGRPVPLVGRVSMDSMVFDVTDLESIPSHLSLLDDSHGVDQMAAAANTIGYEILTSLGRRYQRRYCEF